MICKKCGSDNVIVQQIGVTTTKGKSIWFRIYYWLLFGWLISLVTWVLFFFIRLLMKLFRRNKTKTKVHTEAVCQNCGFSWVIK